MGDAEILTIELYQPVNQFSQLQIEEGIIKTHLYKYSKNKKTFPNHTQPFTANQPGFLAICPLEPTSANWGPLTHAESQAHLIASDGTSWKPKKIYEISIGQTWLILINTD